MIHTLYTFLQTYIENVSHFILSIIFAISPPHFLKYENSIINILYSTQSSSTTINTKIHITSYKFDLNSYIVARKKINRETKLHKFIQIKNKNKQDTHKNV